MMSFLNMEEKYPNFQQDELSVYFRDIPLDFEDIFPLQFNGSMPEQFGTPSAVYVKSENGVIQGCSEPMEISVFDVQQKVDLISNESAIFSDGTDLSSFPATPITPANTPYSTPCLTPASSNPSSPGSSRRYFRAGLSAKKIDDSIKKLPRHKRPSHINAEHRRRSKIQNGFDELRTIVPSLMYVGGTEPGGGGSTSGGTVAAIPKESKASMLKKAADFCRQLRSEVRELDIEAAKMRDECLVLSAEINCCQQQLPDSGLSALPQCSVKTSVEDRRQAIEEHSTNLAIMNWKYGLFSFIAKPMLESYLQKTDQAHTAGDLQASVMQWLADDCSLLSWRPAACNALKHLCMNTSVMTEPGKLPNEVLQLIMGEMLKRQPPSSETR